MEIRLPALRERADKADVIRQIANEEAPNCRLSPERLGAAAGLSLSRETCASSAMCCGSPAARPRTASLSKPISICLRLAAALAEPDPAAAERAAIVEALRAHAGRVTDAARALKLSRATLYRKIKFLKIDTL